MKWFFLCVLGLAVIFIGCDTPYTGFWELEILTGILRVRVPRLSALRMVSTLFALRRYREYRAKMAGMAKTAKTVNLLSVLEASAVPRVTPEGTGRLCIWNWKRLSLK